MAKYVKLDFHFRRAINVQNPSCVSALDIDVVPGWERMACSRWRIAVTGIGLVTPLGLSAAGTVDAVLHGKTAAVINADTAGVALAKVMDFDVASFLRNPKNLKLMSRPVRMALLAVREAVTESGLSGSGVASERTGVYVGSGQTGIEYDEFFKALTLAWEDGRELDYKYLGGMPTRVLDRYFSLRTLSNAGVSAISTEFTARGPSNNYVQGETAPASAIYTACQDLLEDRCDAAIVCGYDSLLIPTNFAAFRKIGLLSGGGFTSDYTPFNTGRSGMVLGEGAGCLILERREDAEARTVPVIGEVDGVGMASQISDTPGFTAGPDDLRHAAEQALSPIDPDFAMARGLGTEADDLAEACALEQFLPEGIPVTAMKGNTGYLGAATAAVELGIGLLCARQNLIPPVFGLRDPDPAVHLNLVRGKPAALPAPEASGLFFSSTFGGQVAVIAARVHAC